MNDEPISSDDRLEEALRRWGAEEAARQAPAPPAPATATATPSTSLVWRVMRATAVAAALLLAVGVCLHVGYSLGRARTGQAPILTTSPVAEDKIADLESRLVTTQEELRLARSQLRRAPPAGQEAARKIAELEERHARELARLQAELKSRRPTSAPARAEIEARLKELTGALEAERGNSAAAAGQLKQAQGQLKQAQDQLTRTRGELKQASDDFKRAQEQLGSAKGDLASSEKALADLRKRLTAATTELSRLSKTHQQFVAEGRKAKEELAALKARQVEMLAQFQRLYLAAAAPGQQAWPARQAAARAARLAWTCGRIRNEVRVSSTTQLLEKLEVVLTRLDLLDADDPAAVQSFAALLGSSGLLAEIDRTLAAGKESARVRAWLLEARLIIMGADRVG